MGDEVSLVLEIAKWVAIWHCVAATYFVTAAENKTVGLMIIASMKALLGACIYLIVIQPEWAFLPDLNGLLLPFTLLLLGAFSIVVTWLIWQHWDLDPPQVRLKKILLQKLFRFRNWRRRRFGE